MYGEQLWGAFQNLKLAADPEKRMNPGKVVYWDDGPSDMREHLRYGADYASLEPRTEMDFGEDGFSHVVELCNGCGTCRQTTSDTMCPTYRASKEEIQATRGRANMLRAAISGELSEEEMYSERFQEEVLDLCVGCKGCMSDCPTGVDMAKLKAELKHDYHQREGTSLRDTLFANIDSLSELGSALAPLSNWGPKLPGARAAMERTLGIAADRELPHFERQSLEDWFAARGGSKVPLRRGRGQSPALPRHLHQLQQHQTGQSHDFDARSRRGPRRDPRRRGVERPTLVLEGVARPRPRARRDQRRGARSVRY